MKRTLLIAKLITGLEALRQRYLAERVKLTGDTWLVAVLILLACISLGVFITYAFLFARVTAFAAI